jgi:hypothetical protein
MLEELVYSAAQRALDQQSTSLSDLRTRTSTLVAAIIIGTRGSYHLWVVALVLLGISLGLVVRALRLPGTEQNGPLVVDMLDARATRDDKDLEDVLLEDLATETLANEQALARKDPLLARAVTLLVLAIVLDLVGVQ